MSLEMALAGSERLRLASEMAQHAGELLLGYRREALVVDVKGAQDFVTQADRAVEQYIRQSVSRLFPQDNVLGEEEGGVEADRLWVIDPIDGTINFIRGLPSFAVSIAYVENGEIECGAIAVPMLGELFLARRGHGAWCNGARLSVANRTALSQARIAAGYAQRGSQSLHLSVLDELMSAGCDVLKFNSAAVCLAHVAAGRIDGYVERDLRSWDVLAGQLLVSEAGGVTNRFGRNGLAELDDVIAANTSLIDPLKAAARWNEA